MCIIFFAYKSHPQYKLILAGNRDEFYDRPTRNAGYWWDHPDILGGRDLEKKGTWLGKTRWATCWQDSASEHEITVLVQPQ